MSRSTAKRPRYNSAARQQGRRRYASSGTASRSGPGNNRRTSSAAQPPPVSGRSWLLMPPAVLVLGVAIALFLAWRMDVNSPTAGEESAVLIEGGLGPVPTPSLPVPAPLPAYRLTYRVTSPGSPSETDEREISRPFDGRYTTRGAHGRVFSSLVTSAGGVFVYLDQPTAHWARLEAGTFRATGDQEAAPALRSAVAHGVAEILGSRRIIGRPCTVVRTGGPIGSSITAPTRTSYTDLCIDRTTGLILDETWVFKGRLARDRLVVEMDTHPSFDASSFRVDSIGPAEAPGSAGETTVLPVPVAQLDSLRIGMPSPLGYHLEGAQSQTTFQAPSQLDAPTSATLVVEHFVDGPQLLDLEQGELEPPPAGAIPVRLADGRMALLTLDMTASYLDVTLPGGLSARLEGPDVGVLLAAGAHLALRSPGAPTPAGALTG